MLPKFFIDRDLGTKKFPQKLKEAGLKVVTLQQHYGARVAKGVSDEKWLRLVADQKWVGTLTINSPGNLQSEKLLLNIM